MSEATKLYQLLKIIKFEQNLRSLIRIGLTYKDIADFTESVISEGFVIINDNSIALTKEGELKYHELKELTKNTNKDQWIDREKESMTVSLEPDFIYLPEITLRIT